MNGLMSYTIVTTTQSVRLARNVTLAPPAVKPYLYPVTAEPLGSVAWRRVGGITHAPPSQIKLKMVFLFDWLLSAQKFSASPVVTLLLVVPTLEGHYMDTARD